MTSKQENGVQDSIGLASSLSLQEDSNDRLFYRSPSATSIYPSTQSVRHSNTNSSNSSPQGSPISENGDSVKLVMIGDNHHDNEKNLKTLMSNAVTGNAVASMAPESVPIHSKKSSIFALYEHPLFHLTFNVTAAIGIVFVNKLVFVYADFPFPITLTLLHITMTALGMRIFARIGFFERVSISKLKLAPLSMAYIGYVVLGNMSIQYNSIRFYQISKILCTPAVMILERFVYSKTTDFKTKASVAIMCLGITLATVTDATVQAFGIIVAFVSVICSSAYSVLVGVKQKELEVGSMQMLHEHSPIAACLLMIVLPFMEPIFPLRSDTYDSPAVHESESVVSWIQNKATISAVFIIILSSIMGLLLNWSMFLMISSTSPLTFNVIGHLKTIIVISGGVLFFGDTIPLSKALSLLVAASGIGWYSYLKQSQLTKKRTATPLGTQSQHSSHSNTSKV